MIIAHHEGLTLRQLDKDSYCLSQGQDSVGRCSGVIIGRNEAFGILMAWNVPKPYPEMAENDQRTACG